MSQVSHKTLSPSIRARLVKDLAHGIAKLGAQKQTSVFVYECMTPIERLMFAKRFAAIIMLEEGSAPYRIHRALGLSQSTVLRLARAHDRGAYVHAASIVQKWKTSERFWETLELLSRGGLPRRVGPGRSKWLRKK